LPIARILAPVGVRGEVKAQILSDFPERFRHLRNVLIGEHLTPYKVHSAIIRKGAVYMRFDGIDTMDDAEKLRGQLVHVPKDEAFPLPEDTYYWHQILDLDVWTTEGEYLGKIVEILDLPANDVYIVQGPRGEVLLPAIEDVVVKIDPEQGRMTINVLPGLLEKAEPAEEKGTSSKKKQQK
jgi:16S rRNA processing protein RimM